MAARATKASAGTLRWTGREGGDGGCAHAGWRSGGAGTQTHGARAPKHMAGAAAATSYHGIYRTQKTGCGGQVAGAQQGRPLVRRQQHGEAGSKGGRQRVHWGRPEVSNMSQRIIYQGRQVAPGRRRRAGARVVHGEQVAMMARHQEKVGSFGPLAGRARRCVLWRQHCQRSGGGGGVPAAFQGAARKGLVRLDATVRWSSDGGAAWQQTQVPHALR